MSLERTPKSRQPLGIGRCTLKPHEPIPVDQHPNPAMKTGNDHTEGRPRSEPAGHAEMDAVRK